METLSTYSDYEYDLSTSAWSSILRLAHIWRFPKIKAFATKNLDKLELDPVDKVVMAREYEVDPAYGWFDQAYTLLGERDAPISKEEGTRLGLDAVVFLSALRENVRSARYEREKAELRRELDEALAAPPDVTPILDEIVEQVPAPAPACEPREAATSKTAWGAPSKKKGVAKNTWGVWGNEKWEQN